MSENTRISRALAEEVRKYISENYVAKEKIDDFERIDCDILESSFIDDEDNMSGIYAVSANFQEYNEETPSFFRKSECLTARRIVGPDIKIKLEETFQEMLFRKIDEKKLSEVETYKAANITKQHFSKIKSDRFYRPKKATVYAFAVAMHLSLPETIEFLGRAGFAISHSYVSDIIMEYFISRGKYDLFEINNTLYEFDQPPLMQAEREESKKNAQNLIAKPSQFPREK